MHTIPYKIIIIGDSGVGKTCLINKYIYNSFDENTTCTVGAAYFSKKIVSDSTIVEVQFWDTAGQERYKSFVPFFMRSCRMIILVYDISRPNIDNLNNWINFIKDKAREDIYDDIYIVGNKVDLVENLDSIEHRKHIEEICKNIVHIDNIFTVSAKNGTDVDIIFKKIIKDVKKYVNSMDMVEKKSNIEHFNLTEIEEELENKDTVRCCYI